MLAEVAPTRPAGPRIAPAAAAATGVAILAVVMAFLTTVLWWVNHEALSYLIDQHELIGLVLSVEFAAVGVIVLRRWTDHALGWLSLAFGLLMALSGLASEVPTRWPDAPISTAAAVIGEYAWVPASILAFSLVPLLFPDGRPASKRWRPLVWAGAVCTVGSAVLVAFGPLPDFPRYHNPLAASGAAVPVATGALLALVLIALVCGVAGLVGLVVRMVRSTGSERRRIAWFFAGFTLVLVAAVLPVAVIVPTIANAALPVFLGVGMLRHGLFDGDRLLNRTLVYGVLTVAVVAIFGLTAGLAGKALGGAGTGAVVAAVIIAMGLAPARVRVQGVVDRLLYGSRRDPYDALTGLGQQLSDTIAAQEVLPTVVRTVCQSLRLPYAAVTLDGAVMPTAAEGTAPAWTVDFPLRDGGIDVGVLTVGVPGGRRFLDPSDERLLTDLAQRAGAAVRAVALTDALRRSRDELAVARDTERYRIRRDLHDGLGPTLAGVALGLDAAQRGARTPADAELIGHLRTDIQGSLNDVKRLVADLRPTALEELGLVGALRQYARTVSTRSDGTLKVTVAVPDPLPVLPPGVEVAAYRIALEAVTNVTRHAAASQCDITLCAADGALRATIVDDGIGAGPARSATGLGVRSMSERAAELGGHCTVTAPADGGTIVEARLPVGTAT